MDGKNLVTSELEADRNLSAKEAAKLLGIFERNLHTRKQRGEIPSIKIGKRVLFPKRLLLEYIDQQQHSAA